MKSFLQLATAVLLLLSATMGLRNTVASANRFAGPVMISQNGAPVPTCPDGTLDCNPQSDVLTAGPRIGH